MGNPKKPEHRASARASIVEKMAGVKDPAPPAVKRGRGRPRKYPRPDGPPPAIKAVAGQAAKNLEGVTGGTCAGCGAPYADGQKACTKCGRKLDGDVCSNAKCGARMLPTDRFCGECGSAREAEEDAPTLETLADAPAKLEDEPPGAPPAASAPVAPAPRPVFNPAALRIVIYEQVSSALKSRGEPPLTDAEKELLAQDLADVLNTYAAIDPKWAVLVRCGMDHLGVLAPKMVLAIARARREEARAAKGAANG